MESRRYRDGDNELIHNFLIELNRGGKDHINWNWARFEWMSEHPEFDKSSAGAIGLWLDGGRAVGAAIYDMYFGEAFCAALPAYDSLYPEILEYAYNELKDDSGLGIAICDDNAREREAAEKAGFTPAGQTETVLSIELKERFSPALPDGYSLRELNPSQEPREFQWLLWRGFDHGEDREVFEREDKIVPQLRTHLDPRLSLAAADGSGEYAAYCCLWYSEKTDYAYVEPVCTAPSSRGKGIAKALLYEALNRANSLGADKAYVLSDMDFYKRSGFKEDKHFTFYWKK